MPNDNDDVCEQGEGRNVFVPFFEVCLLQPILISNYVIIAWVFFDIDVAALRQCYYGKNIPDQKYKKKSYTLDRTHKTPDNVQRKYSKF